MSAPTDPTLTHSLGDAPPPGGGSSTPAKTLDRYVLLSPVGAGAMGVVHAAYDPELDRKVAVKLLKHGSFGHGHQQRLRREAQALAKLGHPNVVTIHDVGEHEGQLYIVVELVDGPTLREWLDEDRHRPWRELVATFIAAGRGLSAAHDAGLVHRDFKPDNVMIGSDGRVRVMDFGLVRVAADTESDQGDTDGDDDHCASAPPTRPLALTLTRAGAMVGTLAYMSPEQCRGRPSGASADQFGFCVALYEALYGRRPFPSHDVHERLDAIASGRLAPPTRGRGAPARLQRVIRCGLAGDPADRWPSMDALLAALDDVLLRQRRGRGLVALAGLVAIGGAVALGSTTERDVARCMDMDSHLDGVWDGPRREMIREAIKGTGLVYAEATWARVEHTIDDYTRRWVEARVEVCEAGQRGELSESLMDRRMSCLDAHLEQVRATVDVLAHADDEIVRVATESLLELPSTERCADVEALVTDPFPLPEDPAAAARIEALSDQITTAEVLGRTSEHERGLELLAEVREEVEAIDFPPLELQATLLTGRLRRIAGDHEGAMISFEQALSEALRHQMTAEAALASTELMLLSHRQRRDAEGARYWSVVAEALTHADGREVTLGRYLRHRGIILDRKGRYEESLDHHQQDLAIRERLFGPDHPSVATALNNVGFELQRLGRFDEARRSHERALVIDEHALGPDHPDLATSVHNLGNVAKAQEDLEGATRLHERALEIREQALGAQHPDVGGSLNSLGSLAKRRGDLEQARVYYLRALEVLEGNLGPEHPFVAGVLSNLGATSMKLGRLDEARTHLERARALLRGEEGPVSVELGFTLYNLGQLAMLQREHQTARERFMQALDAFERTLGPEHPTIADVSTELGLATLELGDPRAALEPLEHALELRGRSEAEASSSAKTHFYLARALWAVPASEGRDRHRALRLAARARELLGADDEDSESIADWLRERRPAVPREE